MQRRVELVVASTRGPDALDRDALAAMLATVRRRGMPLNLNDDPLVAPGGYLDEGRLEQAGDGAWELHLTGSMIEEVLVLQDSGTLLARRAQVRRRARGLVAAAVASSASMILQYDAGHYRREDFVGVEELEAGPELRVLPFRRRAQRSLPVLELGLPLAALAAGWLGGGPGGEPQPGDAAFRRRLAAAALERRGGDEGMPLPPTLVFSLPLEESALQGVARSESAAVLTAAGRGVGELLVQGLSWQEALQSQPATRLVFRFGGQSRRWELHYALLTGGELLLAKPADRLRQTAMEAFARGQGRQ